MLLWFVFAVLTVIALLGAALPLLRGARNQSQRAEYDLQVYRHQLDELKNDLDRGVITSEEEEAARIEVERRILSVSADHEPLTSTSSPTPQIVGTMLVAIGVPALASGLYLYLGAPQSPDQPFAGRTATESTQPAAGDDLETAVSRLKARLAQDSGSLADWLLLGQSYTVMRRYEDAVAAYRQADGLKPDDTDIMTALGESLVLASGGTVTPEAQAVFRNAYALNEKLPGPRFYAGLARTQAGDLQTAYDIWIALAQDSPADAPWMPQLMARLEDTGSELGIDVTAVLGKRPPAKATTEPVRAPGPTQEDVAAAADMSASDRSDMIRGMVARLAERLQENPNDLEGWERLARSYEVLGEAGKAENARMRAQALRDGVDTAKPTSPQRGPSQKDIADAQDMSSEDRSAMIRNMVKGLAARLEENPSDAQGWIMLARSYQVLKQSDKAQESLRRAQEVAPDDPALLIQLGTAIVDASEQNGPLPANAITVFSRVLELDSRNPDALYFMGMERVPSGEIEAARNTWEQLLSQLDAESRAYEIVRQQIDRLPDR